MSFRVLQTSKKSKARLSRLTTNHGTLTGPFFMTIATRGAVRNVHTDELRTLGVPIVLANTYHLLLRPGDAQLERAGGLHTFMGWRGPILTDSGGYQVFSLSQHRKITEHGVTFRDPSGGKQYVLTPESAIDTQYAIGSDIMMVLDECPPYPCDHAYAQQSLERTTRWAQRCFAHHKARGSKQKLFGIVQGSTFKDLRIASAQQIAGIAFDGYAVGGVAVGEPKKAMRDVLRWTVPHLPSNRPRYLMGVGRPDDIVMAVKHGIDMFDCVIPTREARHGRLYLWKGDKPKITSGASFYKTISITNTRFAHDHKKITKGALRGITFAYLHHLFKTNEGLGLRLASLHNIEFYQQLMRTVQGAIRNKQL